MLWDYKKVLRDIWSGIRKANDGFERITGVLNYYNPDFGLQDFLRIVNRMPCIMEMTFSGDRLLGISELAHVEKEMPL